ncbi:DNA-binding response regulator [Pseudoalteromonas phenolica]|uniref:DNA-binding response regulator n=1 Tax=Pseudoalteromonas phenolica TaxID=161398 RepID=A0A5R9Q444_9GAMM|nr:response regulator transcription factor [Pseudoalteromonas phenolica]TLX47930.1 DNA-binding response regulator [Pseudoalteromonas phenolica]
MNNKIKVCLVDDQMLIREGIKSLLNLSDKVSVVGECSDGSELAHCITETSPEVILLDLSMPIMNGIDTLKWMKAEAINIPVIVLTTFDDHEWVLQSIQEGAKGFLLKDVSLDTLVEAIESVNKGQSHIQPAITERLLSSLSNQNTSSTPSSRTEALTEKEQEILRLMASGCSNKEIALALYKSEGTIKNHVSNILSKLGVRDRTRAVLLAIEKGLI